MQMSKYMYIRIYTCTRNAHTVGWQKVQQALGVDGESPYDIWPPPVVLWYSGILKRSFFFSFIILSYFCISYMLKVRKKFRWPLWIITDLQTIFFKSLFANLIINYYMKEKFDFYSIFYSLTKKLYPSRMKISNGNFI